MPVSRRVRQQFQSTRPVRGATCVALGAMSIKMVSIHAPRAGRDHGYTMCAMIYLRFNPRAPCGARLPLCIHALPLRTFQSTRPVRGATIHRRVSEHARHVSIHAPRAGRDTYAILCTSRSTVSIHAPRAGRDNRDNYSVTFGMVSIHAPRAGRDESWSGALQVLDVSIHAPRAGRDSRKDGGYREAYSFNPRAPCGARLASLLNAPTAL